MKRKQQYFILQENPGKLKQPQRTSYDRQRSTKEKNELCQSKQTEEKSKKTNQAKRSHTYKHDLSENREYLNRRHEYIGKTIIYLENIIVSPTATFSRLLVRYPNAPSHQSIFPQIAQLVAKLAIDCRII